MASIPTNTLGDDSAKCAWLFTCWWWWGGASIKTTASSAVSKDVEGATKWLHRNCYWMNEDDTWPRCLKVCCACICYPFKPCSGRLRLLRGVGRWKADKMSSDCPEIHQKDGLIVPKHESIKLVRLKVMGSRGVIISRARLVGGDL